MEFYLRLLHGPIYFIHCGPMMVRVVSIPVWYFPQYDCLINSTETLNTYIQSAYQQISRPCETQRFTYMELEDLLLCLHETHEFPLIITRNSKIHCHIYMKLKI